MRKIILSILFLLLMVNAASAFSGGAGTSANPWQISTLTDLQAIGTNSTTKAAHYIQINDIDASTTSTWNSGVGFLPISTFTGHYDGQDYTITGLYINRPLTNYIGLFGIIGSGGIVENLGVIDAQITGQGDVGVLAGRATLATINRCYTSGTSSGAGSVGGFIGVSEDNSISNSFSRANVANSGYISGGFCASVADGGMANCYSTGTVTGVDYIGGFVGYAISSPPVTSCFWDTQTSGMSTSALGTGKTTAQMKTQSTFTGWDFNNVWRMEGYPVLSPNRDFYLYPGNITINRDAPPLLHSITLDMFRYGTYSYDIIVSQDPTYTEIVYNVNSLAQYPMSNHTRTISLNAGEYWMTVHAKDSNGNVLETLTREFEISQTFNLGTTSAAGAVFELVSGVQTPVNGATITIYNDTFSNNYVTGTTGYYQFTGLAAGSTYYITATKNGYAPSNLNLVTPTSGQTVTKNIILQKEEAPTYIMPHYVRFTVRSLLGGFFEGVTVSVFEGDSATPLFTQVTGDDGAVGFELSENIRYRLTLVSEADNINTVYQVTPTKSEYNIYVSLTSNNTNQADAGLILYGMHIDGNQLNVTWQDTSGLTSLVEVTIKNRDDSIAYYLNSTDSDGFLLQDVNTTENLTYIVELKIQTAGLDETFIRTHILTFESGVRPAFDLGFSAPWQSAFLAALSLIFLAVIFGSGNAHVGAILVSLGGLFHVFVTGWIPASVLTVAMNFIAVIMSVFFYMRKSESIR